MFLRLLEIWLNVFVGLILLTHVVLPHHHHNDTICVVESHCDVSKATHEHNGHQHDGQDVRYCALKDPAMLNSGRLTPIVKRIKVFAKCNAPGQIVAVLSGEISGADHVETGSSPELPLLALACYSRLIFGTSGLRAPPVV